MKVGVFQQFPSRGHLVLIKYQPLTLIIQKKKKNLNYYEELKQWHPGSNVKSLEKGKKTRV